MSTIRAVSSAVATTLLLALALSINASLASDATPVQQQSTEASPQQESILARAAVLSDQRAKAAATRQHKKALADRSKRERQAALERAQRAKARTAPAPKKSSAPSVSRAAVHRISGPLTGWKARYWAEAQVWAQQPKTRSVIFCESSNDPQKVSKTGKYRGLYQMDADFWASYGGLELASRPDLASRAAQNYVAYRGYVGNGWGRWECA